MMMGKNYRKVISIMLCAIMIFIMTPQVFAESLREISTTADESGSTIIAEDVLSNGVKWTIYQDGLLEISGVGDVPDYYSNNKCSAPWYTYAELINKIMVTSDIKSIGYGAFYGCENVTDITLPFVGQSRDATGYRAMFGYVFGAATYSAADKAIYMPAGQVIATTSEDKKGCRYRSESAADVFVNLYACDSYDEINSWYSSYSDRRRIFNIHGESYFYRYFLFTWSFFVPEKLKSVTITDATKIEDAAFNNCKNITDIRINDGVTSVGNFAFQGCASLENEPIHVTGISLDKTTASMATGETLALTPVFAPETATNKTVIWSSSDNTVATVDDGVVTAVKKGSATITVKTEDGGFTASCVVTVNCAHANKTEHPAEASTCTKHGHADYTTCDDCGEVIEGSANELPLAAHTGGTATCKDKAVCEICGEAYGELNPENHTGKEVWEQTETTHTKKWNCCGKVTVAESDHEFEDGVCTVCAYPCAHKDENTDHVCDICGVTVSEHTDDNNDHKCDICGKSISNHADDDNNHICDLCGKAISNHVDSNNDHVCDICGKTVSNHVDDNTDHICDICGKTISNHIDENNNHLCDTCGKAISNHVDSNNDHVCDICGKAVSNHVDDDNNHVCDICGKAVSNHVDDDNNHICDLCGKIVSNHSDENHDHICDLCSETISTHTGGTATCTKKAVCEICGEAYGELNPENHTGGTHIEHEKAATCTEKGSPATHTATAATKKLPTAAKYPPSRILRVKNGSSRTAKR